MSNSKQLITVLLVAVVVLLGFIAGMLVIQSSRNEPPAAGTGTPEVAATVAAVDSDSLPAPATAMVKSVEGAKTPDVIKWIPQQNGCTVEQAGTKFHIVGTNDKDGWDYWNGVTAPGDYALGDFEVSVDFMVPAFKGMGNALMYLRAKTTNNEQVGILYQPRAGRYQVQGWASPSNKFSLPSLQKFGDEATTYHRMRLKYEVATQTATGWVDDRQIGTLNYALTGALQFEMVTNTDRAGNEIDIYFDHFSLTLGGVPVTPKMP